MSAMPKMRPSTAKPATPRDPTIPGPPKRVATPLKEKQGSSLSSAKRVLPADKPGTLKARKTLEARRISRVATQSSVPGTSRTARRVNDESQRSLLKRFKATSRKEQTVSEDSVKPKRKGDVNGSDVNADMMKEAKKPAGIVKHAISNRKSSTRDAKPGTVPEKKKPKAVTSEADGERPAEEKGDETATRRKALVSPSAAVKKQATSEKKVLKKGVALNTGRGTSDVKMAAEQAKEGTGTDDIPRKTKVVKKRKLSSVSATDPSTDLRKKPTKTPEKRVNSTEDDKTQPPTSEGKPSKVKGVVLGAESPSKIAAENVRKARKSPAKALKSDKEDDNGSPSVTFNRKMTKEKLEILSRSPLVDLITQENKDAAAEELYGKGAKFHAKKATQEEKVADGPDFSALDQSSKAAATETAKPDASDLAALKARRKEARRMKRKARQMRSQGLLPDEEKEESEPGVIYLGHIPHGFYESEMRQYFSQFGEVLRVRLSRSKKTARSRGFAFIEFADKDVAQISAEAMDGYLMFGQSLVAKVVPPEKLHPDTLKGADKTFRKIPFAAVERRALIERSRDPMKLAQRSKGVQKNTHHKQKRLAAKGIQYDFPSIPTA